jgi:hypothetical protein
MRTVRGTISRSAVTISAAMTTIVAGQDQRW